MHINEGLVNNQTFARTLSENGWTVGMFGKYLNNNPKTPPIGIDAYMTNGGGNYENPQFDTAGISDLAPWHVPDGGHVFGGNYTTSVVGNVSIAWIKKVAPDAKAGKKPFMAYIAPKACHEPFTPAPWYSDFWDENWPATEPRPVSWNCSKESRADHHHTVQARGSLAYRWV